MKKILVFIVVPLFCSCVTYNKCKEKFGDSVQVITKDSIIYLKDTIVVKADTATHEVSLEELLFSDVVKETNRQKNTIKKTSKGFSFVNICKSDTIYKTDTIRLKGQTRIVQVFEDKSNMDIVYKTVFWSFILSLVMSLLFFFFSKK